MVDINALSSAGRVDLAQAYLEFVYNPENLVASKACPIAVVNEKDGTFLSWDSATHLARTEQIKSQPGVAAKVRNGTLTEKTFNCELYKLATKIPLDSTRILANAMDLEDAEFMSLLQDIMSTYEKDVATLLFDASGFTAQYTDVTSSSVDWDTHASADPVGDVLAAAEAIYNRTGKYPNTLIINRTVLSDLKRNADIKDRVKHVSKVTDDELFADLTGIFGLKNIIVGGNVSNSDGRTVTKSKTIAKDWSNLYAMVCHLADTDAPLSEPSLCRTILYGPSTPDVQSVREWFDEAEESKYIEIKQYRDEVICDRNLGQLLKVRTA